MKPSIFKHFLLTLGMILAFSFSAAFAQDAPCHPDWQPVRYPNSVTAYGVVTIDGAPAEAGDVVGAFVGNECRDTGNVVVAEGNAYATLVISGSLAETITFKLWDASACQELDIDSTVIIEESDQIFGTPPDLLAMNAISSNPNPTSENMIEIVPEATVVEPGKVFSTNVTLKGTNIWAAHVEIIPQAGLFEPYNKGYYASDNPFFTGGKFTLPNTLSDDGKWVGGISLKHPEEPITGEGGFAFAVKYKVAEGIYGEATLGGAVSLSDKTGNLLPANVVPAVVMIDDGLHVNDDGSLGDGVIEDVVTLVDGTPVAGAEVTISLGNHSYTVVTDENGAYRLDELKDLAEGEVFTLQAVKDDFSAEVEVEDVDDVPPIRILNTQLADLNKDNIVSIADFTLLSGSYGLSEGDTGYDARADINGDKSVTIQDLALLGSHWNI